MAALFPRTAVLLTIRDMATSCMQTHKPTNYYHGALVELTEAMTSMGLSGGQTVMSMDVYERIAPFLQDLDKRSAQEQKEEVRITLAVLIQIRGLGAA